MTFILGMRCLDGMAIFGDTLESGSVVKRYRQKVHAENIHSGYGWGVAWGVAGNAHVADKFTEKLTALLGKSAYDRLKTELVIEQCLKWIRKQYAGPEEEIDIVLGMFGTPKLDPKSKEVYSPPESHLYRGDSLTACLAPVRDYWQVGMDVTLAHFLLANMRNPFGFIDEALRLGVFATAVMKQYAAGVGGDTNVFVYRANSDDWIPLLDREVSAIESDFPVKDIEQYATSFWAKHPKARNNGEMLASEMRTRKAARRRPKLSDAQK
jgi:hypothetical protein